MRMMRRDLFQSAVVVPVVVLFLTVPSEAIDTTAERLLAQSNVPGGLVVHLGCGTGERTGDLYANDRYLVHGLDTDAANVLAARRHLQSLECYGPVSVDIFDGHRLPYIDNLVNLVVADTLGGVPRDELLRVLAPRGVALIGSERIVKPWPESIDHWTHWLHGPDNNAVSRDRRVGIARSLQWTMPPLSGRHHNLLPSVSAMVSAGGRIYAIMDEAPIGVQGPGGRWSLIARDAFNGLLLWKQPIHEWGWQHWSDLQFGGVMRFKGPDQLYRRLAAADDVLYATLGFTEPVVALDGATGEIKHTYEGTEDTSAILYDSGTLFLTRNVAQTRPGKDLLAIDAATGNTVWERTGYTGITSRGDELQRYTDTYLTVGDAHVFFLDEDEIVALDKETGAEAWRHPRPALAKDVYGHNKFNFTNFCTLVFHDGVLVLAQIHPNRANLNAWQQKDLALLALDADSGKKLWETTGMTLAHFTPPDLFITGGLVWTMEKDTVALCGLDLLTGEVRQKYPAKNMLVGHHHRCYRNKATERFYLAGEEGIEYIRFDTGELDIHHWLRGACGYGLLPANGLIYMPTHACGCHANAKLNGFFALRSGVAASDPASLPDVEMEHRLERGHGFGMVVQSQRGSEVSEEEAGDGITSGMKNGMRSESDGEQSAETNAGGDWPMYRRDPARSNYAPGRLPVSLSRRWEANPGGRLTPPVIADGRVFLAAKDRNAVICLDAEHGREQWVITTDGPVDTPPTWHAGRLLFGTHAGSVYAVEPDTGTLIWRFRAAPAEARLLAFGRLESPWPVHGSVLVAEDRVYCVAGRSMHLDGGLFLYALDAATGQVLQQANLQADTDSKGEVANAVLPELLVRDGQDVCMRNLRFEGGRLDKQSWGEMAAVLRVNDGGLLDDSWINNNFWKYGAMQAQMIAFDGRTAYGVQGVKKLISKSYGQDIFVPDQQGYLLSALEVGSSVSAVSDAGRGERRGGKRGSRSATRWQRRVPVRAQCLVATDDALVIAGAPDVMNPDDPWAAFDGRCGGLLQVHATDDGEQIAEYTLDSPPVFDGLAIAQGHLYLATSDGRVICLAE